jgi:hypothetical protein
VRATEGRWQEKGWDREKGQEREWGKDQEKVWGRE